jgi:hypothetical protein
MAAMVGRGSVRRLPRESRREDFFMVHLFGFCHERASREAGSARMACDCIIHAATLKQGEANDPAGSGSTLVLQGDSFMKPLSKSMNFRTLKNGLQAIPCSFLNRPTGI